MRRSALIMALYMTSTLAACAQPGPDGAPPGYGQNGAPPDGYGQGTPPAYAQQGWAGGMQSAPGQGAGQVQGPPSGYAGQGQPPGYAGQGPASGYGGQGPAPGYAGPGQPPGGGQPEHMDMAARFRMANTTHDGRLTLAQAQAGGMGGVAHHFRQIDRDQKGYVTLQDVREWHHAMHAQRMEGQGQPGAQPPGGPGGYPPPGGNYPPPDQGGQQY